MQYFGVVFLYFAIVSLMVLQTVESRHGTREKHNLDHEYRNHHPKRSAKHEIKDSNVRLPRILRRTYDEFAKAPENFTVVYHTIPVTLEHIKDDFFYITAPYRIPKTSFINIYLFMEFSNIEKSDGILSEEFLLDIIPVVGSREMAEYHDDCSLMTIVSKPHFPEGELEMKFDLTTLYQACQVMDKSPTLKYKIRFHQLYNTTNIHLTRDNSYMFFLFREVDDGSDIMSYFTNSKHLEPLNYHTIMAHVEREERAEREKRKKLKKHKNKKRVPRSLKSQPKSRKSCALLPYIFDFGKTGWTVSLLAPLKYNINRCNGRCAFPLAPHLNYTNYAVIKAIASTMYKEIKNPNCIDQDLDTLLMLGLENGGDYTLKRQKDMVTTSCRCC